MQPAGSPVLLRLNLPDLIFQVAQNTIWQPLFAFPLQIWLGVNGQLHSTTYEIRKRILVIRGAVGLAEKDPRLDIVRTYAAGSFCINKRQNGRSITRP